MGQYGPVGSSRSGDHLSCFCHEMDTLEKVILIRAPCMWYGVPTLDGIYKIILDMVHSGGQVFEAFIGGVILWGVCILEASFVGVVNPLLDWDSIGRLLIPLLDEFLFWAVSNTHVGVRGWGTWTYYGCPIFYHVAILGLWHSNKQVASCIVEHRVYLF